MEGELQRERRVNQFISGGPQSTVRTSERLYVAKGVQSATDQMARINFPALRLG